MGKMPGLDQTGPMGMGKRTGRGLGSCGPGLNWRRSNVNRGLGQYFSSFWPQNQEDQKKTLTDYQKALEEELEDIKKEVSKLSK
jgi:hypothetical protein